MAEQTVKVTERPWADEVRKADPSREQRPAYEFSNGKRTELPKNTYGN